MHRRDWQERLDSGGKWIMFRSDLGRIMYPGQVARCERNETPQTTVTQVLGYDGRLFHVETRFGHFIVEEIAVL